MSRASRARRVATAAAFGGGSIGALSAAALGVIYGETKLARRRIRPNEAPPPRADGTWAVPDLPPGRAPLRVAVLGDSSAAGYGLHDSAETPAAVLARGLSAWSRRPVDVVCVAVVGAQSAALGEQVERVLPHRPDLVYVMIGANDITHRVRPSVAVRALAEAVTTLIGAGSLVVVGTCPDLGTIRPMAQPLRYIARRRSRNLAAAQTIAVVEAGGRTVSLGNILGPRFAREHDLFGEDHFHPSALGLITETEPAGPFLSERARPIARAAARAATHPGTEVAGAQVHGSDRGHYGRWARLLRRRTPPGVGDPETADQIAVVATMQELDPQGSRHA